MGLEGDAANSALYQNFVTAPVVRTLSTTTARTAALATGRHRIVSDVDCYILQGADDAVVALTTSSYLPANVIDYLSVTDSTNDSVAGITAVGTGSLFITLQAP